MIHSGLGQPIQPSQQQRSLWWEEAEWNRFAMLDYLERLILRFEGRELGSYALDEYTSVKAVHWNFGETLEWPL